MSISGQGRSCLAGFHLGDGVQIGANAVVNHSFPKGSIVASVSARVTGQKPLTKDA